MARIPQDLRETIAANIRLCRRRRYPGRGGAKLCVDALGISAQLWSSWEHGKRTPDETRLRDIANLFDVSVEYLRNNNVKVEYGDAAISDESKALRNDQAVTPSIYFRCPFYSPPKPGQPLAYKPRSLCWLVEKMVENIQIDGLRIRLSSEDVDMVLQRHHQFHRTSQ